MNNSGCSGSAIKKANPSGLQSSHLRRPRSSTTPTSTSIVVTAAAMYMPTSFPLRDAGEARPTLAALLRLHHRLTPDQASQLAQPHEYPLAGKCYRVTAEAQHEFAALDCHWSIRQHPSG